MAETAQEKITQSENKPKSKYWRFLLAFFAVIIGIFILYIIGFWAVRYYQKWQTSREMAKLAAELKQQEDARYAAMMADTHGGKTPQETLQMYIAAAEKGDYELASKYFVIEKQEEWGSKLSNINEANGIKNFITPLKEDLSSRGEYSYDSKEFSIYKPVGVDFVLYPNGIWKIIEI